MFLLPVTWIYDEFLLGYLGGAFPAPSLLYILLFTLADSLLLNTVLIVLNCRFRTFALVSLLTSLYFTIESVVKESFTMYFSPASLLSGAGSVAGQYAGELQRGLLTGLGRMALFSLPLIFTICARYLRQRKERQIAQSMDTCEADSFAQQESHRDSYYFLASMGLILAVLIHYGSSVAVQRSPYAAAYGAQFNFNEAVGTFGLTTATRLGLCYDLFGNPYLSFSSADEGELSAEGLQSNVKGTSGDLDASAGQESDGSGTTVETASDAPQDTAMNEMEENAADEAGENDAASGSVEPETPEPAYNVMDIDFGREELQGNAATLSAYLATQEPSLQNGYTGIFRGKNLILICAESYCDAFIRPELTPTLWRLSHNGICFSDFYQPSWGGSTTTGELSLVEGLDSNAGVDAVSGIADHNHYFTMGNQLQRLGYFSLAFHNGSHTFYHRNRSHTHLGYDAYFACGQHMDFFTGHNYPTDTEMFEGTMPAYIGHAPFSVYYMTVSGHAPYEKSSPLVQKYYDQVNAVCGDEYMEKTKYYICYQMELENALSSMVRTLEEAGIAEDTVIVMTGDHYPYGLGNGRTWNNDRDYIDDLMKTDDALYWNEDKSGLVIWSGALENELREYACEVSEPVSSLDILPTVSNLFGVEFDSRLLPGRDVFAENTEPLVFWNNRSWVTAEGKYDTRKGKFYPPLQEAEAAMTATPGEMEEEQTAEEMTPERMEEINALVENKILMCSQILKLDYYGLIFGPDESEDRQEEIWALIQNESAEHSQSEETTSMQTDEGVESDE